MRWCAVRGGGGNPRTKRKRGGGGNPRARRKRGGGERPCGEPLRQLLFLFP